MCFYSPRHIIQLVAAILTFKYFFLSDMGAFNSQVYLDIGKLNISGLCGSSEGENVNANVNVNLELKGFLFSRT